MTNYLVGFEDLEPSVCDMIQQANVTSNKMVDQIQDLRNEIAEFKAHVEKMTSNTDMPMLKPIKAIIDEQITTMYTFQNEIKLEIKKQELRSSEYENLIDKMKEKIDQMHIPTRHGSKRNSPELKATNLEFKNLSPIEKLHQQRDEILNRRMNSRNEDGSVKNFKSSSRSRSRSGSPGQRRRDLPRNDETSHLK